MNQTQIQNLQLNPHFQFCLTPTLIQNCEGTEFTPTQFSPTQSDPEATGYDVRCAVKEGISVKPGCRVKIPLGFQMFAPPSWWLFLAPRSSTYTKKYLHPLYGIIDETFENEMMFVAHFLPDADAILSHDHELHIPFGEKIGQVIPMPRFNMTSEIITSEQFQANSKSRNATRSGGFGSTGKF